MLAFNEAWYLEAYPHIGSEIAAGLWTDAQAHYEQQGAREGLSPNDSFDETWYRQTNPDVGEAIEAGAIRSGYWHYLNFGNREGRNPNSSFDEQWYCGAYPEVGEAVRTGTLICGYQHFLDHGRHEGLAPNPLVGEATRRMFRQHSHYAPWLDNALVRRRQQYPAKQESLLISLVTSAYNTPIEFLRALAYSVVSQDFGVSVVFDWVILDNGSTDPATIAELRNLAQHDFVRFFRVEQNLGIMGGMRFGVEKARGRYIVPVDSDDLLCLDAVRILASSIQTHSYPALLYSDEDKVDNGEFFEAYLKPGWDPVLFFHSCYIAHLCAIDRGLAAMLGAYTDDRSRGCHDWDTFMRFYLAGYEPIHVPEVLYSWRRHSGSCASDITSKDYIHSSHRNTLQRFLDATPDPDGYRLEYSPLFQRTPDWRIERLSSITPGLTVLVLAQPGEDVDVASYRSAQDCQVLRLDIDSPLESAAALLREQRADSGLVRLVSSSANPLFGDWFSEALTFFELFPDTVMVGGPVYDDSDRTLMAGVCFGFDSACGCPDRMRIREDPGYFAQMWKPHSVSAVSAQHAVVDGRFLLDALASRRIPHEIPLPCLGEWLGAVAGRWQKRVVYSPFLGVRSLRDWHSRWTSTEKARFVGANRDLIPDTRFYSLHLGLFPETAYLPVTAERHSAPSPPTPVLVGKRASA